MLDGVLVIDKPVGPTSHDVVARVRRVLRERRVGHTGTLDPAASGVLPLVIGRATRLARFLSAGDKHYEATIRFGWSTDTGDAQGVPIGPHSNATLPDRCTLDRSFDAFRGAHLQQPPAFSAKKIAGRRSYELARTSRGNRDAVDRAATILPKAVPVVARSIEVLRVDGDCAVIALTCSAGFYVRALARDLGEHLGIGAHLAALRRLASAGYDLKDAVPLERVESDRDGTIAALVPLREMLPQFASVVLTADGATRARRGQAIRPTDCAAVPDTHRTESGSGTHEPPPSARWVRLFDPSGEMLGLAHDTEDAESLHPAVVLV